MFNAKVLTKSGERLDFKARVIGFVYSKKVTQITLTTDNGGIVLDAENIQKISIKKNRQLSQWSNGKWRQLNEPAC